MPEEGAVYVYRNGRYRHLAPGEFRGFPSAGVWLVWDRPHSHCEQHIMMVGEVPSLYPFACMMLDRDELANVIVRYTSRGSYVPSDLAAEIMRWLATKHGENAPAPITVPDDEET